MNLYSCKLHKLSGTYSPIIDACVTLNTSRGLVSYLGVLVVDVVLLLALLIGLLRYSYNLKNPVGIWKLLYQQVTT